MSNCLPKPRCLKKEAKPNRHQLDRRPSETFKSSSSQKPKRDYARETNEVTKATTSEWFTKRRDSFEAIDPARYSIQQYLQQRAFNRNNNITHQLRTAAMVTAETKVMKKSSLLELRRSSLGNHLQQQVAKDANVSTEQDKMNKMVEWLKDVSMVTEFQDPVPDFSFVETDRRKSLPSRAYPSSSFSRHTSLTSSPSLHRFPMSASFGDGERECSASLDSCGMSRTCSCCSTDSRTISNADSRSPEIRTVKIDLSQHVSLGITVVGHSSFEGDCGIFVGCVRQGGAAQNTGLVRPGDWIVKVNDNDLKKLTNREAIELLQREAANKDLFVMELGQYWASPDYGATENCQPRRLSLDPLYALCGDTRLAATRRPLPVWEGKRNSLESRRDITALDGLKTNFNNGKQLCSNQLSNSLRNFTGLELLDWMETTTGSREQALKCAEMLLEAGHMVSVEGRISDPPMFDINSKYRFVGKK